MKILVCVKNVLEFEADTDLDIHGSQKKVVFDQSTPFRLNCFDAFAVEEALAIKEQRTGVDIDAITVGPDSSAAALQRVMGMGVNNGIHVVSQPDESLLPSIVSFWIASYAIKRNYDLILTGIMSEDEMQGQTGSMLAEHLDISFTTSVLNVDISESAYSVRVEREREGGYRQSLELRLPAVLTVQSGINLPRYPSLSNVLRAKKKKLIAIQADTLGQPEAEQTLLRLTYPEKVRGAAMLDGTVQEKARSLLNILKEKSFFQ